MDSRDYLLDEINRYNKGSLFKGVLNINKVITSLSFMNLISLEKFGNGSYDDAFSLFAFLGIYGFVSMFDKERIYRKESLEVRLDINEIALYEKDKYNSARSLLEEWFNNYYEESKDHAVFALGDIFFSTSLFLVCSNTLLVNIFDGFTIQEIGGLISGYLATRFIDNSFLSSLYYRLSSDAKVLLDLDDISRQRRHK